MYKDLINQNDNTELKEIKENKENKENIFYNNSSQEDKNFLEKFDFNNNNLNVDVIIRNTFPILYYQMLLIFDYYKLLPQYINNSNIVYKVLKFISSADEKDMM